MWQKSVAIAIVLTLVSGYVANVAAQDSSWQLHVGSTSVRPKSNNSSIVNVDDNSSLTLTISYYCNDNWAFEVLAAVPVGHDIESLDGSPLTTVAIGPSVFGINVGYRF